MKLNQVKKMETEILEKQLRTTDENLESKSSLMQSQRKVKQHFIEDKWEEKSDFYQIKLESKFVLDGGLSGEAL